MIGADDNMLEAQDVLKWIGRGVYNFPKALYGFLIEDVVGGQMPMCEAMQKYNLSYDDIKVIMRLYYQKPERSLTLGSRV